ncbi:hypothetical protein SK128_028012 [Halocaridina rubra]|uniref:Uncharacterized protein n=1 Tax=Halocaridina rubra TaxID=373956 RepID=A0AAN9AGN7_HALRR
MPAVTSACCTTLANGTGTPVSFMLKAWELYSSSAILYFEEAFNKKCSLPRSAVGGAGGFVGSPSYCTVEVNGSGIELYNQRTWRVDALDSVQEKCCLAGTLQI